MCRLRIPFQTAGRMVGSRSGEGGRAYRQLAAVQREVTWSRPICEVSAMMYMV